ncbi:hypothetical protein ACR79M_14950 [Sphingobacterium spiritivorum]|uniref:hypothetical protein n=1 Tax=Sphingobacterium spiritivorum TaxID=258 RepID=UPI003DA642B2
MKQKQITTGKATIVVVDMPEGSFDPIIEDCMLKYYVDKHIEGTGSVWHTKFPFGNYKPLGLPSWITEDQWKEIVDLHYSHLGFDDYDSDCEFNVLNTATESGLSLLRANGVVLENPVTVDLSGNNELNCDYAEWQTFESQIWKNPYIFIKVKLI